MMLKAGVCKAVILHLLCKAEKQKIFVETKISSRISNQDNQVALPRDFSI